MSNLGRVCVGRVRWFARKLRARSPSSTFRLTWFRFLYGVRARRTGHDRVRRHHTGAGRRHVPLVHNGQDSGCCDWGSVGAEGHAGVATVSAQWHPYSEMRGAGAELVRCRRGWGSGRDRSSASMRPTSRLQSPLRQQLSRHQSHTRLRVRPVHHRARGELGRDHVDAGA